VRYSGRTMNAEGPKKGLFELSFIEREMEELPSAVYERIRRERRAQLTEPLFLFLELLVRVSGDTWATINFLCRRRADDHGRRREFVYSVPPLTRTLLESLLTVIYIFDSPSTNIRRYYAGGWLDQHTEYKRYFAEYGGKPGWEHLADVATEVEKTAQLAKISNDERVDAELPKPKLIKRWPNPGQFGGTQQPTADPKRTKFLLFLKGWFYGRLSGDSHLNFPGLVRRGWFYAEPEDESRNTEVMHDNQQSLMAYEALSIQVALLTEISCQLALDYEKNRLRVIWEKLLFVEDARQFYEERYKEWLG
jgi:hypothetical protein